MIVFSTLRQANEARQKYWDPEQKLSMTFKALELAGEVGELCNVVKKLEREIEGLPGSRVTFRDIEEEIADVAICLDLLAAHFGIDVEREVVKKFNKVSDKQGFPIRLEER